MVHINIFLQALGSHSPVRLRITGFSSRLLEAMKRRMMGKMILEANSYGGVGLPRFIGWASPTRH